MALPFATNERGVLQLQPLFGPIWGIAALWIFLDRSSIRRGLYLGLAIGVTFLTSEYYALLLLPVLALGFLLHTSDFRKTVQWRHLGLAAATALVLILPFGLAQASRLEVMGFQRSDASFARTSAWPADYLRPSSRLRMTEVVPELELPTNQRLYPGVTLSALAIFGVVVSLRADGSRRRWTIFLLIIGGLGFVLSLGSHLAIAGTSPLTAVHRELPILGYTRSAFRFGALTQLALALLAAGGLANLWARSRILAVAIAIAALALLELAPLPERLVELPDTQPAWTEVVEQNKPPIVVHIPWAPTRSASSYADTTRWMIESLPTGAKLVNGYSGFFPTLNAQLRDLLESFPDVRSIEALGALGVDHIVVHDAIDSTGQARLSELLRAGQITEQITSGGQTVLRLPAGSIRQLSEYEGDWRLRTNQRNGKTWLEGFPAAIANSTWVYVAGRTELDWKLRNTASRDEGIQIVPKGTLLFFAGSDDWLRLSDDLPTDQAIELVDGASARSLGLLPLDE
jgi:hypothetical protein